MHFGDKIALHNKQWPGIIQLHKYVYFGEPPTSLHGNTVVTKLLVPECRCVDVTGTHAAARVHVRTYLFGDLERVDLVEVELVLVVTALGRVVQSLLE